MPDHWSDSEPVVRLLAGRWTLAVLSELARGGRRYQDLHTALDRISHKVLTDTLRRAEREGLVTRHVDRNRVETATLYELTDLGCSLGAPSGSSPAGPTRTGPAWKVPDGAGMSERVKTNAHSEDRYVPQTFHSVPPRTREEVDSR